MPAAPIPLIDVKDLCVRINTDDGPLEIISHITFSVNPGEKLGIVGESGCGKSITALSLMGLLPENATVSGQILFDGHNLPDLPSGQLCRIRGDRIGMIFQEPMTALNPVKPIGAQIEESLVLHARLTKKQRTGRVIELMDRVGLPVSRFPLKLYPHQLSGGQRQRIMIAIAVACDPDLLIADEPTTALDVTVQLQILELIEDLAARSGMALVMISHDLGVIAQTTENVMVMYAGHVMEKGPTQTVFRQPAHPYTKGLLAAIPRSDTKSGTPCADGQRRFQSIPGQVPDPGMPIPGCAFADRCPRASDLCRKNRPGETGGRPGHRVWCHHPHGRGEV